MSRTGPLLFSIALLTASSHAFATASDQVAPDAGNAPIGSKPAIPVKKTHRKASSHHARLKQPSTPVASAPVASGPVEQTSVFKATAPASLASVPGSNSEQFIVTGTRDIRRTALDSSSPIDIVSGAALQRTGARNLSEALAQLDPSINSSILQGSGLVSSIHMRGLSPNEVLVLIDGKRRHSAGVIATYAGPEHGATPVDLDLIPISAIDHIEVLRDGAAAMYGSDAIAGVVNVILKKRSQGFDINVTTGAHPFDYLYHLPGWDYQINADGGWAFGNNGYVHLAGQVYHADHYATGGVDYRSGLQDDENFSLPEQTRESLSIKAGETLADGVAGYGLITYAHRHLEGYTTNRLPNILPEIYPYGFNPYQVNEENDYSATLGLNGDNLLGFHWDISTTYGADENKLSTVNSANLNYYALYSFTPTKGFTEAYRNAQWTNNLDLSRGFSLLNRPLQLAFGAEHRLETYDITSGNPPSYLLGGFQGAPGLTPVSAGSWGRDVWAGYLDTDFHPTKSWDLDLAGRVEHYTDFGDTETGKLSTRYEFSPRLAIRGTVSNGFRAPTLAEENFSSLSVTPTGATGSLAVNSPAARALGAVPLKPERSTNVSAGIVAEPIRRLHVTVDVYQINIRDRIVGGGNYNGLLAEQAIALTGITLPPNLVLKNVSANYFSNGASTRTQGLDIVADYSTALGRYGTINWSAGIDLNRTRLDHLSLDSNGNPLLNAQSIGYITTTNPRSKIVLSAHWTLENWSVNLRQTRYGETTSDLTYQIAAPAALQYSNKQFYEFKNAPRWLTDLEIGYRLTRLLRVSVGGNNIFNIHPRELPELTRYIGNSIYDTSVSGIPISGGYYYGRVDVAF